MRTALAILALVLVAPNVLANDNWQPDDTDYGDGITSATPNAMASDATYVYAIGTANNMAVMRRRLLTGGPWESAGSYVIAGGTSSKGQAMAHDASSSSIYAFGQGDSPNDTLGSTHWWVIRSTNHGGNWTPMHVGSHFSTAASNAVADAKFDGKLRVAITASGQDSSGHVIPNTWVLKESTDFGATWNDTASFAPQGNSTNRHADAVALGTDGNGHTVSVGFIGDSQGNNSDTTRGPNWTFTDQDPGFQVQSYAQSNGVAYQLGTNLTYKTWIVRASVNGGVWGVSDSYTPGPFLYASAIEIFNGVPYAGGLRGASWYVRRLVPGATVIWADSDVYGAGAGGVNAMHAAGGHLWAVGARWVGGVSYWVTRIL